MQKEGLGDPALPTGGSYRHSLYIEGESRNFVSNALKKERYR